MFYHSQLKFDHLFANATPRVKIFLIVNFSHQIFNDKFTNISPKKVREKNFNPMSSERRLNDLYFCNCKYDLTSHIYVLHYSSHPQENNQVLRRIPCRQPLFCYHSKNMESLNVEFSWTLCTAYLCSWRVWNNRSYIDSIAFKSCELRVERD